MDSTDVKVRDEKKKEKTVESAPVDVVSDGHNLVLAACDGLEVSTHARLLQLPEHAPPHRGVLHDRVHALPFIFNFIAIIFWGK